MSAEDYMLTFIPDYLELVRKDCKVLECNVDEITEMTTAKGKTGKNDLVFIDAVLHYFVGHYGYSFKKIFTPFRHTIAV